MKIVVAVRCLNGAEYIERFLHGYDFADAIVVSDGGSTDGSIELLEQNEKVQLHHFDEHYDTDGIRWNPDAPHMNFVLNKAKELEPDWLIFDDLDCWPNFELRKHARTVFEFMVDKPQMNAFRLYMWGEDEFFPRMNNHFDPRYTSLWAWMPKELNIYADESIKHGTLVGLHPAPYNAEPPMCLLHYSWHPDTIDKKLARYKVMGLNVDHPFNMKNAGAPVPLPGWTRS